MTDQNPPQQSTIDISSLGSHVDVAKLSVNVSQELIITTEDKVRLCLLQHLGRIEQRNGWITPLTLLLTIIVTLFSATFKDFIISAATWNAIFIIVAFVTSIWLIFAAFKAIKSEKIEDVINLLKKNPLSNGIRYGAVVPKVIAPEQTDPPFAHPRPTEKKIHTVPSVCPNCGHINPPNTEKCLRCARHIPLMMTPS